MMADEMVDRTITVGTDYAAAPGGRFAQHGANSGEDFRDRFLAPALRAGDHVTVYLDGTAGYAGSFLEEAFGGLIRVCHFTAQDLSQRLEIKAHDSRYAIYVRMVQQYLKDAAAAARAA
jgi:hypothetical protein